MNTLQKQRLIYIFILISILATAVGLILYALRQNINLFFTPTTLVETKIPKSATIKIGGWVERHSVNFAKSGKEVVFIITDHKNKLTIKFRGILPTLFREGQGVIVTGKLSQKNYFIASQILAKHDEKYRPPILRNKNVS